MKTIKRIKTVLFNVSALLMLSMFFASCTESVPVGYVGIKTTTGGVEDKILEPGNHSCWGRDKLYLLETSEEKKSSNISILCKDDLNFKFTVNTKTKLDRSNKEDVFEIFSNKGGASKKTDNDKIFRLDYDVIYDTYASAVVDAISRSVVSKYETTQIRDNRDEITKTIYKRVKEKLKGTPVLLLTVDLTNFDYPDIITKALEKAKERQIERNQEKHKQELKLMRLDNEKIATLKEIEVQRLKGKAEAAYINEIQRTLNDKYITLKQVEANTTLYNRVRKGDKVIVQGDVTPMVNTK